MNEHEDEREDETADAAGSKAAEGDAVEASSEAEVAAEVDADAFDSEAAGGDADASADEAAEPEPSVDDHSGPPRITPLWQRLAYPSPPLWYRVAQILLPPLLAAGAVGVHWWLNVPEKILESPKDQGSKARKAKKARDKKKKPGRRTQREEPRTPEQLDADWETYRALPFDDEPTRSRWARRNQAMLNQAMVVARRDAFEGAPEEPRVVLASAKCRTIRCRFVLRSPYEHELEVLTASLEQLEAKGEPVWRDFRVEPAVVPDGLPSHEHYVQVTVGLQLEDTDSRSLEIPGESGGTESGGEASGGESGEDTPTEP